MLDKELKSFSLGTLECLKVSRQLGRDVVSLSCDHMSRGRASLRKVKMVVYKYSMLITIPFIGPFYTRLNAREGVVLYF